MNLSDNMITKIEGLEHNPKLETLLLKRNKIGKGGLDDVSELLKVPSISVLDIQDNIIEDENILPEIFEKMPNLAVLYTQNNGFCKKIKSYRKTMIARLPNLKYLDDRPVFEEDRRFAEAWYKGGLEAEREERAKFKKEQEEAHMKNHQAFREMMEKHKREKEEEEKKAAAENDQSDRVSEGSERTDDSSIPTSKLSTYNSENTPSTPTSSRKNELSDTSSRKGEDGNSEQGDVEDGGSEKKSEKEVDDGENHLDELD